MKVGLRPNDDDSCGWYHILPAPAPTVPLTGEQRFDHVVLGAGFTGLAAARRLAEHLPEREVALVDAQRVGYGASGRNSGFIIDLPHNFSGADHAGALGRDRSEMRLNRFAIAALRDLVEKHGIDCQWSERGKYHAAVEDKGMRDLEGFRRALDRLGEPYRDLDAGGLSEALGTRYYREAIHTPGCVLVQPAALARGLGASLPENVRLFEDSPVVGIDYGDEITLECAQGTIRTKTLLLANNGFASAFGFERNRLIPIMTFGSLTPPLTEAEQAALGGEPDWGVIPADHFGTTLRYTRDRRLLIRNWITYSPEFCWSAQGLARIRRHHEDSFKARFPMLPEVQFGHTWGGVLTMSRNGAPCFGRLADNVFAAVCQNGVGVAKGTYSGTLLADLVVGAESDLLRDLLSYPRPARNVPQPFLGLGVRAKIAWDQMRAGRER
ncbi:MAG: FAD-binding oxidoreductase [Proteobacteria bacterium]|nr:FAD-binding oxidoreductase [Pseudomonadota bacterium]